MQTGSATLCRKGTELQEGTGSHPSFDCNQSVQGTNVLSALDAYAAILNAKLGSGECPAPGFAAPD